MKNGHRFSILTSLVAAVFILSLLTGTAWAQKPTDLGGDQHLLKFENTGQLFEQAKGQFENALKQFNSKRDVKSMENLIEKAKDYLEKAIDHTVSYLEVLRSRAENPANQGIFSFNVSSNIDAHVAQLEALRTQVQQANNISELRTDNQQLKDIYAGIRLETRYDYDILLNNNIGKFIGKADNVTARLNATIQNLNNQSKDTSSLVAIRDNFTALMQQAATEQQNTTSLLATHTGFDSSGMVVNNTDAKAFLTQVDNSQRETVRTLKQAAAQLQKFVNQYRRLSGGNAGEGHGRAIVMGTGTLTANGSGRAVIEGNVTVTLSGVNDTLLVYGNAAVTTDAGTNQTLGNGQVKYQGFTTATITGEKIRVAVSGDNISFTATGTGAAVLNGNGTYSTQNIFGVSGGWKKVS